MALLRVDKELLESLSKIPLEVELVDSLKCVFCNGILRRPMQLIPCGHRACMECIKGADICSDGELITQSFKDNVALRDIMTLKCFCIHKEQGCDWSGLVHQVEDHLTTCVFNEVHICAYSSIRCKFKGDKAAMQHHYEQNQLTHDLILTVDFHEKNILIDNIVELSKKNSQKIMTVNELHQDFEKNREVIQSIHQEFNLFKEDHTQWMEIAKKRISYFDNSILKFPDIIKNIDEYIAKAGKLNENIRDKLNQQRNPENKDKENVGSKIQHMMGNMKKVHEESLQKSKVIAHRIVEESCTIYDGHYFFSISKLSEKLLNTSQTSNNGVESYPFYTGKFGYKFKLKVLLHGDEAHQKKGEPPHMALYIALMPGYYDAHLNFPFKSQITFKLKNQTEGNDLKYSLIPNEISSYDRCFNEKKLKFIGFSKFISHSDLHNGGFIRDDRIFIEVIIDDSDLMYYFGVPLF